MITIITPTLNGENFLQETYESIKKNKFFTEWIIVDGGSTDKTLDILYNFKDDIIKIYEIPGNSSKAINYGIKNSKNKIVGVIGCDDLYEKDTSEIVKDIFLSNENCKWCVGQNKIINENGIEIQKMIKIFKNFRLKSYNFNTLITENFIPSMSVFWKKEINLNLGYWDENIINCNDYDMWLRFAKKYKPIIINRSLSCFRIHSNNSSQKNFKKTLFEAYEVSQKYFNNKKWYKLIAITKIYIFVILKKIIS